MSVTVHYIDGDPVTYAAATSAHLDSSGLMRLLKWNRKKRRLEDVDVLNAKRITLAEVMRNGAVEQRVLGLGQRDIVKCCGSASGVIKRLPPDPPRYVVPVVLHR